MNEHELGAVLEQGQPTSGYTTEENSLLPLATTQPMVLQEEMEIHEPLPHPLWNVDRLHLMPVTRAAVCSRLHEPA